MMRRIRYALKKILSLFGLNRFFYRVDSFFQLVVNRQMRKELNKNKKFHNLHRGERCFIIGNGPSINEQDLTKLSGEITFTVNQFSRRSDFIAINSTYHVWTDKRFFAFESSAEEKEMLSVIKSTKNKNAKQTIFYAYGLKEYVEKYNLNNLSSTAYLGEDYIYNVKDIKKINLTRCIPGFSTVIHYAIFIALYMGFSEIYLLGCDCTGFITTAEAKMKSLRSDTALYGYNITESEKRRLERVNNVFSIEEELSFYANIFKNYRLLNCLADSKGVKLINLTKGGLLEDLRREEYETVIEECNLAKTKM